MFSVNLIVRMQSSKSGIGSILTDDEFKCLSKSMSEKVNKTKDGGGGVLESRLKRGKTNPPNALYGPWLDPG